MELRVISGSKKGTILNIPNETDEETGILKTRPMMDRTKSAIFSIIQERIQNANVADLYAGSGALGIECLSRGASRATFVDISKNAIETIEHNLFKTKLSNQATIIKKDVNKYLKNLLKENLNNNKNVFDLIFICPPWAKSPIHSLKLSQNILSSKGIVIVEHPIENEVNENMGDLEKFDEREYGKTCISFYRLIVKNINS